MIKIPSILKWFKNLNKNSQVYQTRPDTPKKEEEYSSIKFGELRKYIEANFPPYTWARIGLRLYKDFLKEGLHFADIKDNYTLSPELVKKIDDTLYALYKKRLPKNIVSKN